MMNQHERMENSVLMGGGSTDAEAAVFPVFQTNFPLFNWMLEIICMAGNVLQLS